MRKITLLYLLMIVTFTACSPNDTDDSGKAPKISFANKTDVYVAKVGQTITIEPIIENDQNTTYSWESDGKILSIEKNLSHSWNKNGQVYITLKATNNYGSDQKEIRVDIALSVPPKIELNIPKDGYDILVNEELKLTPYVRNSSETTFAWSIDKEEVSKEKEYIFKSNKTGIFNISLSTKNIDGTDFVVFNINVKAPANMPFSWSFEKLTHNVSKGRTIHLTPLSIKNAFDAKYIWSVDGEKVQDSNNPIYSFKAESEGTHTVTVTMKNDYNEVSQNLIVNVSPPEGKYKRQANASSKKEWDKVYEYLPAPGQFINENYTATTMEQAIIYAEERLKQELYVSLGGFGGYIVLGFDHSIDNDGGYNFQVLGNAFNGSSEPGIIWVMQDENGDGLPNDTWYELKGSEHGKEETISDYEVTYYRPDGTQAPIAWNDNLGKSGYIDYMDAFHQQEHYYPMWVSEKSYILRGTCLKSRTTEVSENYWTNGSFEWGYSDNFSSIDRLTDDDNYNAGVNANHFKISNAVTFNGKPAELKYIDFIKIQTGVNAKAGWLGEVSTEVFGAKDYNLIK